MILQATNGVQEIVKINFQEPSVPRLETEAISEEIWKLISCIDNNTVNGRRDLVVVLFAVELVIRSGDICRLKLSDIHWERSTIGFIQFKTGVFNQLPLLENIKFSLLIIFVLPGLPVTLTCFL